MNDERNKAEAEQIMTVVLDRYSNLEKALVLAEWMRELQGGTWVIDMTADGGFRIERRERP